MTRRAEQTRKVQDKARKRLNPNTALTTFVDNSQLQLLLADDIALTAEVSAPSSVDKDPVTYKEAMS